MSGTHNEPCQSLIFFFQVADSTGGGSFRGEGNRLNDLESC